MIAASDPAALTEWAVGFQRLRDGRTLPRIAVHYGNALYELEFERIADVRLKGFDESTEIFIAREPEAEG